MPRDVQNSKDLPKENDGSRGTTHGAMQCQAQYTVGIYVKPGQKFAKLTKIQRPFIKSLNRSFKDFFAKTRMQSPFAKPLEMLSVTSFFNNCYA
jgi:hypothetical protein